MFRINILSLMYNFNRFHDCVSVRLQRIEEWELGLEHRRAENRREVKFCKGEFFSSATVVREAEMESSEGGGSSSES